MKGICLDCQGIYACAKDRPPRDRTRVLSEGGEVTWCSTFSEGMAAEDVERLRAELEDDEYEQEARRREAAEVAEQAMADLAHEDVDEEREKTLKKWKDEEDERRERAEQARKGDKL